MVGGARENVGCRVCQSERRSGVSACGARARAERLKVEGQNWELIYFSMRFDRGNYVTRRNYLEERYTGKVKKPAMQLSSE